MTYGVVLGIALLHVGFIISILSYWLAARALCPGVVDWAEARYRDRPWRTLLMGVLLALPMFALGVVLTKTPFPGVAQIGGGILLGLLLAGLVGSAGLAQHIGRGLTGAADADRPWRGVLRGGGVLLFTLIMPLLGWFILAPAVVASGVGATVSALRRPRAAATA